MTYKNIFSVVLSASVALNCSGTNILIESPKNAFEETLITILRDHSTSTAKFQETTNKLTHFLVQKASAFLKTQSTTVQTPLAPHTGMTIQKNPILVPILRSGLSLLPGFLEYFRGASVGFLGLKRDETTAIASMYYNNLPKIESDDTIIILEPMLATGGTLIQAINELKKAGVREDKIIVATVICAPEGIKALECFPNIKVVTCACDTHLNTRSYIVPGLGDFGDRYFGTAE